MTETSAARANFAGISALLSREPGYSVAKKCLEVQAESERRDPKLRQGEKVWLHESAQSWYLGALGEIAVGKLLAQLGPEWFVRHAIPIGAGTTDVDHLLIGPPGVIALNTKHHRGQDVWVGDYVLKLNGANKQYLNSSLSEGLRVGTRLAVETGFPVEVHPALVFVGARSITDIRKLENRKVSIVADSDLIGWLHTLPPRLSEGQLGLIRLAAEQPETWHIDSHAADTFRVMQRFERLHAQVGELVTSSSARVTAKTVTPAGVKPNRAKASGRRLSGPVPSTRRPSKTQRSRKRGRSIPESLFFLGLAVIAWIFHDQIGHFVASMFMAFAMQNAN